MSNHIFLKDKVNIEIDVDQYENFEGLIGALNQVLAEQYKCQICYDESEVIDTGKTIFNGFMVEALEDPDEQLGKQIYSGAFLNKEVDTEK
tara:strand:- start:1004 stop:1276 length:273 start_codon:yes stop_codon:yes gene_type:complete